MQDACVPVGDARHPFFSLAQWWQTLPATATRGTPFDRVRCLCLAASAAPEDALPWQTTCCDYWATLHYSLQARSIRVRGVQWHDAAVCAMLSPSPPRLHLPLAQLPSTVDTLPLTAVSSALVAMATEYVTKLADVQTRPEAPAKARELLDACGGDCALLALQIVLAAIVAMPHDTENPLHSAAVEAAVDGYAVLVAGFYATQLPREEVVLNALGRADVGLPFVALAADGIRRVPGQPRTAGLPRYTLLDDALHACHGAKSCRCHRAVPLCIVMRGRATPALALAALARMCDRESLVLPATLDSTLRYSVGAGGLLVVWSLVYDLYDARRYTELAELWQAQLLWDTCGLAELELALPDAANALRAAGTPSHVSTTLRQACAALPVPQIERGRHPAPLCTLYDERGMPMTYGQIGEWAQRVARDYVHVLRAEHSSHKREELHRLAARHDRHRLFDGLRQRQVRAVTKPEPAFGVSDLWRSSQYRRLEDSIGAKPELVEQFFRDLVAGRRVRASGPMRLQAEGLSFSIGGKYRLSWKEWSAKQTQRRGHGLGSLVMHYQGLSEPQDAFDYIQAWTRRKGGKDARLDSSAVASPRRATVRVEGEEREEGRRKVCELLERCAPVTRHTTAWRYLRETRGLADAPEALIEQNPALRACTHLRYVSLTDAAWHDTHGLVVVASDHYRAQRIYLDRTSVGKRMDMERCKLTLGLLSDADGRAPGVVVQTPPSGAQLCFVAEGPETALSVACAWPDAYVCATLGVQSLPNFVPPAANLTLIVCREQDTGRGAKNINTLVEGACRHLRDSGRVERVISVWPPAGVKDFNDVHQRTPGRPGTDEIRLCIQRQLTEHGIDSGGRASLKRSIVDLTDAEEGDAKRNRTDSEADAAAQQK